MPIQDEQRDSATCPTPYARIPPDDVPAMMHAMDAHGVLVWVSNQWLATLGYSRVEVLGRKSLDFFTRESRRLAREHLSPSFHSDGHCSDVFYRMIAASGNMVDVLLSATHVRDEEGGTRYSLAVIRDITEFNRVETALRESEEKFRAMSNACYDALIMIDSKDIVVFWNRAAEKMFGYSAPEALGSLMHELITLPGERARAREGLKHFAKTGQGPVIGSISQFTAMRKDGSTFPVERSVDSFQSQGKWYAVGIIRDITERKEAERKLLVMATTDSLTGLNNRRNFRRLSRIALEHAARYNEPLSLILYDIDHFKRINDTHGHDIGDVVLHELAERARTCFRQVDILGRLGGEEFAVCLPQTEKERAVLVAERFREMVERSPFGTSHGLTLKITVSLGIATLHSSDNGLDGLVKRADMALYMAKSSGRNRSVAG